MAQRPQPMSSIASSSFYFTWDNREAWMQFDWCVRVCVCVLACVRACVCGAVKWVALRWPFLFSLCFPVLSLPSHVIVFCINPLPSLRASRRLVRSFFSFVTPLFQKASLIETEGNKKRRQKKPQYELKDSGVDLKWNDSNLYPKWWE